MKDKTATRKHASLDLGILQFEKKKKKKRSHGYNLRMF